MNRRHPLVLTLCLAALMSGCSQGLSPRAQIYPVPEAVRRQFGNMAVVVDSAAPEVSGPWTTANARSRGAAKGVEGTARFAEAIGGNSLGGPVVFILGAPFAAGAGAISAPGKVDPAADDITQRLVRKLKCLQIDRMLAARFDLETSTRTANHVSFVEIPRVSATSNAGGIGTVLELRVMIARLTGINAPNPPLRPLLAIRARLIRASDHKLLYVNTWSMTLDDSRTFAQWDQAPEAELRRVVDAMLAKLVPRIVDELFLLCNV